VDEPACKSARFAEANDAELLEMNASVKNEEDTGELSDDEPTAAAVTPPSTVLAPPPPQLPMGLEAFERMQQAMRLQRQYLEMMARQPTTATPAPAHGANGKQVRAFGDTLKTQLVTNVQAVLDRSVRSFEEICNFARSAERSTSLRASSSRR